MNRERLQKRFENLELNFDSASTKVSVFKDLDLDLKKRASQRFQIMAATLFALVVVGILVFYTSSDQAVVNSSDLVEHQPNDLKKDSKVFQSEPSKPALKPEEPTASSQENSSVVNDELLTISKSSKHSKNSSNIRYNPLIQIAKDKPAFNMVAGSSQPNRSAEFNKNERQIAIESTNLKSKASSLPITNKKQAILPNIPSETLAKTKAITTTSYQEISKMIDRLNSLNIMLDIDSPSLNLEQLKQSSSSSPINRMKPKWGIGVTASYGYNGFRSSKTASSSSPDEDLEVSALAEGKHAYKFGVILSQLLPKRWSIEHRLLLSSDLNHFTYDRNLSTEINSESHSLPGLVIVTSETQERIVRAKFLENDLALSYHPKVVRSWKLYKSIDINIGVGPIVSYDIADTFYATDEDYQLVTIKEQPGFRLKGVDFSTRLSMDIGNDWRFLIGGSYSSFFKNRNKVYDSGTMDVQAELSIMRLF